MTARVEKQLRALLDELQQQNRILSSRIRFLEERIRREESGARLGPLPPAPKTLGPALLPARAARRLLGTMKLEVLESKVRTRVRADFLFMRATETPCNANGFIQRPGIVPLREAIQAASRSFRDAAVTGLQGNAGKPWEGVVTVNGACGLDIGNFLGEFARNPRPNVIQAWVRAIAAAVQIRIAGEVTVSYRRVFTVRNRLGNRVERFFAVPGRPDRRFIIGERIRSPEEMGAVKRLKEEGGEGFDFG